MLKTKKTKRTKILKFEQTTDTFYGNFVMTFFVKNALQNTEKNPGKLRILEKIWEAGIVAKPGKYMQKILAV